MLPDFFILVVMEAIINLSGPLRTMDGRSCNPCYNGINHKREWLRDMYVYEGYL